MDQADGKVRTCRRSRSPLVFSPTGSLPPIAVFKPHDVVLAQVAPRLDFYEEKRDLPHVFESMLGLDRDMGGLVFGQKLYLVASCHPRGARHHHPVDRKSTRLNSSHV